LADANQDFAHRYRAESCKRRLRYLRKARNPRQEALSRPEAAISLKDPKLSADRLDGRDAALAGGLGAPAEIIELRARFI
jgi:hypothetical protein